MFHTQDFTNITPSDLKAQPNILERVKNICFVREDVCREAALARDLNPA